MLKKVKMHLIHHKNAYIFFSILLLGGFITGMVLVEQLETSEMNEYISYLFEPMSNKQEYFKIQFTINMITIIAIFLMGFSLLGIPFISFFMFTKGVQIGLSSTLLVLTYEWKGILGIILTIIPQILLDLIAYYMIAIVAYEVSYTLIKAVMKPNNTIRFKKLFSYCMNDLLIASIFIYISCYLKVTLVDYLIQVFTKYA